MSQKNGLSILSNFIWRFAERCGAQGVTFLVTIILARILDPTVYGIIALVQVFTTIMQVFVDSGMGNALIQKKDADDIDFSSVFYFNLAVCIVLYCIMFFAAPFIAAFYKMPDLTPVIRVSSIILIISGIKNVQQAYVARNMIFKKFFYATLGGTLGAAVIGIALAYLGGGVWALVAQLVFNAAMDTLILWITVKWRPKPVFSLARLKVLFDYGWKMLASALLDTVSNNIRQLVIGKLYTTSDLAFYNRGKQFPELIVNNIDVSISSVMLPALSKEQDNTVNVKNMTSRAIKTSTYIMAPLMMGLVFTAEPLVRFILTEKWLPCVPFLRIFCITYIFFPIHTANLNAIQALGRSDLFLKLEILKKAIVLIALFITAPISVMAMAYSLFVIEVLGQIINTWPNKKLLNYSYFEQLKDIFPCILLALFMGICVSFIPALGLPDFATLLIQVILGAVVFIGCSAVFKLEAFTYLWGIIKGYFDRV